MRLPVWFTLGVAILVSAFGSYRIWLATRKAPTEPVTSRRRGWYAIAPRTQLLIGIVYLLLGAALFATTFGWNPIGGLFGPDTATPTKANAPTKGGLPIDTLPAAPATKK